MTARFGPCDDWPVTWTCELDAAAMAVTGQALATATEILWALSGRQFGTCSATFRPCRRDCADAPWGWTELFPGNRWLQPALIGGQWFNIVCGGCAGNCSCALVSEIILPSPVNEITEVKVDGVTLDIDAYRVDNSRFLIRTDGGSWPWCNNLNLSDDQPGTWSVTALFGQDPPAGAAGAVGELACEIIKSLLGDTCKLPENVQNLVRQGVSIQFPDATSLFEKGRTGLYLVDLFVATWNPNGLKARSRVYSVDQPTLRRTDT